MSPVPAPLGWLDHLLFLVLAVVMPVRAGIFGMRRLQRASERDLPRVKLTVYRRAMTLQWTVVAAVAALWLWSHRSWPALGVVPRLTGGLVGVVAGLAIIVAILVRQGALSPDDPAALERVRERTRHLARMLPTTRTERSWFFGLAVTAGICEEILYRGYLIWYLIAWAWAYAPHQAFLAAAIASSLVFGVGHAYQGWRGVLLTAAVGGFLAAIYWITRSLFAGMLVHALMDLHAGYLSHLAYRRAAPPPADEPQGA